MNREELKRMHAFLLEDLKWFDERCRNYGISYSLAYGTLLGAVRHEGFIPWDDDLDLIMTRENYDKMMSLSDGFRDGFRRLENYRTDPKLPIIYGHLADSRASVYHKDSPQARRNLHIDISVCDRISDVSPRRLKARSLHALFLTRLFAFRRGQVSTGGSSKLLKTTVLKIGKLMFSGCSDEKLEKKILKAAGTDSKGSLMAPVASPYGFVEELLPAEYYEETVYRRFEDTSAPIFSRCDEMLRKRYGDYLTLPPEDRRYAGIEQMVLESTEGI